MHLNKNEDDSDMVTLVSVAAVSLLQYHLHTHYISYRASKWKIINIQRKQEDLGLNLEEHLWVHT